MSQPLSIFDNNTKKLVSDQQFKLRQGIYTNCPARIISTKDYEKYQCVSVEFMIRDVFTERNIETLNAVRLEKVFVLLPRFAGWKFKYPIKEGNLVTLWFSHKDLSEWLDSVGESIEQDVRFTGQIEDCYCIFEGGTRKDHNNPSLNNLIIEGPNMDITFFPNGNITTNTKGSISTTSSGTHYIKASHLTIDNDTTITKNLKVKGNTDIEGNLKVGGNTESTGIVTATSGVYASTYAGLGGGAASFAVDMGINGTVTINGVVINTHTHLDAEGRPTGGPQ